jgi:hypothetical protein
MRGKGGRFVKGCPGGPGRPPSADGLRSLAYLVKRDDWRTIIHRAVEQARNGDAEARAWLAAFLSPPRLAPGSEAALTELLDDVAEMSNPTPESPGVLNASEPQSTEIPQ